MRDRLIATPGTDPAMKKKSFGLSCPVARTLETVGDPWSMLIVRDALRGVSRFSEFERSLGISKNILSDRLGKLESFGVLERATGQAGSHPRYALTHRGRELAPVIIALYEWGRKWRPGTADARKTG